MLWKEERCWREVVLPLGMLHKNGNGTKGFGRYPERPTTGVIVAVLGAAPWWNEDPYYSIRTEHGAMVGCHRSELPLDEQPASFFQSSIYEEYLLNVLARPKCAVLVNASISTVHA